MRATRLTRPYPQKMGRILASPWAFALQLGVPNVCCWIPGWFTIILLRFYGLQDVVNTYGQYVEKNLSTKAFVQSERSPGLRRLVASTPRTPTRTRRESPPLMAMVKSGIFGVVLIHFVISAPGKQRPNLAPKRAEGLPRPSGRSSCKISLVLDGWMGSNDVEKRSLDERVSCASNTLQWL